ncbi:MAG TPA: hypothetical protein VM008_15880 [Phycisphaerae bacterium]|nr:hypothetical protein [Phycisphaerae bacterium]
MRTKSEDRFKPKKSAAPKKTKRPKTPEPPTIYELLKEFVGCVKDAPSDLAKNHDHYAHGAPKRYK